MIKKWTSSGCKAGQKSRPRREDGRKVEGQETTVGRRGEVGDLQLKYPGGHQAAIAKTKRACPLIRVLADLSHFGMVEAVVCGGT